ncbi:MAG: hypothetical protein KGL18_08765 [Burkholderiales bacterium]|nr:hypothetical protein [Burkholderiales bacterium]MDE1926242.1 hypothetical protein [Burkholderiales bacterium]MDE2158942.1 hypothetical protein [Burkholderiales bacterium]MDE2503050.1 hypothetical protein [Burkholderiales bacterium]
MPAFKTPYPSPRSLPLLWLPLLPCCALLAAPAAQAEPAPRSVPLERALIEKIRIEGRVRAWELDKICIDGQAYLVIAGPGGQGAPTSIAAAFKDGKPESCQLKPAAS